MRAWCLLAGAWLVRGALWLAGALLALFALFVCQRALKTRLALWLPEGRLRARLLRPVRAQQLVLVTGAGSGIGLALSKRLHALGYSLAACCLPGAGEPGAAELGELAARSPRLFVLDMDVRSDASVARCYERVEQLLASHALELFAVVNNAGVGSLQPFAWLQRGAIRRLLDTNLLGSLLVAREFLPLLAARSRLEPAQSKRLVFVSSGLGFVPGPTYATYGATKAAQLYLARCLNWELRRRHNVHAVAVVPHNFIKNTGICARNNALNQAAWLELKPVERRLYGAHFDAHAKLAGALDEATRRHRAQGARKQRRAGLGARLLASVRGDNAAASIEQSGALDAFELALRLAEPPEVLFAGDSVFQLLVGSLLLLLPAQFSGLLAGSVARSMYR